MPLTIFTLCKWCLRWLKTGAADPPEPTPAERGNAASPAPRRRSSSIRPPVSGPPPPRRRWAARQRSRLLGTKPLGSRPAASGRRFGRESFFRLGTLIGILVEHDEPIRLGGGAAA